MRTNKGKSNLMCLFKRIFMASIFFFAAASIATANDVKEWTIYIHLNADNSLCSASAQDLTELKSLDVSDVANIIVAFDCSKTNDSRLFELRGNQEIQLLQGQQEFDMGDINFFKETAMQVFNSYPSNKRMIIFWNHGSGWSLTPEELGTKGVSYDDQSGHHFTTVEVGQAIKDITSVYPVEMIGYDACLMQMAEISYEYADYVHYTVASEDSEPAYGWDYKAFVKSLKTSPTPEELGKAIVDSYVAFYPRQKVTQSLIDNFKLKDLTGEIARLVPVLKQQTGIKKLISSVPGWYYNGKDLGTFLDKLTMIDVSEAKRLYQETVVYTQNSQPATGLAIYISTSPNTAYQQLKFSQETGWFDFLKTIK